jgi:transposase
MTSTDGAASSAPLSPRALSLLDGAPPYETLKRWRREFSHPRAPHKRKGRSLKVTLDEQHVMGGYALFLLRRLHIVDAEVLIDFLSVAFNKSVDKSWVSRHMHELGFSSHRPAGQPLKYFKQDALPTAIAFVEDTRPTLNAFGDKSRIVAMDQISFWDNGLVTSSYSPIGG